MVFRDYHNKVNSKILTAGRYQKKLFSDKATLPQPRKFGLIVMRPKKKAFNQFLSDFKTLTGRGLPREIWFNFLYTRYVMAQLNPTQINEEADFPQLFTTNWFDAYTKTAWHHFLGADTSNAKNYLEIGSFEGRSTRFAAKLFPNAHLTCIDTFSGSDEHSLDIISNLEQRFYFNTRHLEERMTVLKGPSLQNLVTLQDNVEKYDIIFIDGSHFYRDVILDTALCWPLLKVGGYMVWDDYFWGQNLYGKNMCPKPAIDHFLRTYREDYEAIFTHVQVCVKKIKSEQRWRQV